MGDTPSAGDRDQAGRAWTCDLAGRGVRALPGPDMGDAEGRPRGEVPPHPPPAPLDPRLGDEEPVARVMQHARFPQNEPRHAEPWRAPLGSAAWRSHDMPAEGYACSTGDMTASGLRQNDEQWNVSTNNPGRQKIRHALGLGEAVASRFTPIWNLVMQGSGVLEGVAPSEGFTDLISGEDRKRLASLLAVAKICLPKACCWALKRSPRLASGVARTPAERVAMKIRSFLMSEALDRLPDFATRALSMGSEPMLSDPTTDDGETASGELNFERGLEVAGDAAKRYGDYGRGINVEAPEEHGGARGSPPARRDASSPARPLTVPPPANGVRMLDIIRLFMVLRHLLSLWQIVDGSALHELAAHALQIALSLLAWFPV